MPCALLEHNNKRLLPSPDAFPDPINQSIAALLPRSRRSFLGELSEAAGPAAEKDIGKITYRYQPAAPTAKKQPKWKSFPALSRRELKQKLGIPRGDSLPKELLCTFIIMLICD